MIKKTFIVLSVFLPVACIVFFCVCLLWKAGRADTVPVGDKSKAVAIGLDRPRAARLVPTHEIYYELHGSDIVGYLVINDGETTTRLDILGFTDGAILTSCSAVTVSGAIESSGTIRLESRAD